MKIVFGKDSGEPAGHRVANQEVTTALLHFICYTERTVVEPCLLQGTHMVLKVYALKSSRSGVQMHPSYFLSTFVSKCVEVLFTFILKYFNTNLLLFF